MRKPLAVEVDERRLTHSERVEYRRRSSELAPEVTQRWAKQVWRYRAGLWSCAGVGVLLFFLGVNADGPDTEPLAAASFTLILLPWTILCFADIEDFHARRRPRILAQQAADYLDEIGYAERPVPRPHAVVRHDRDSGVGKSRRRLQHEWYGEHRELKWQDRVLAEALGLDADTYISNFRDHDKG